MRQAISKLPSLNARQPHAGLYFDQRCRDLDLGNDDVKRNLVVETAAIGLPAGYESFLKRWRAALEAAPDTRIATASTSKQGGRVAIGLGGKGLIETGITLHRTWGLPYLPGSALKGLARSFARRRLRPDVWGEGTDAHRILFGDQEAAGFVVFHDAMPVPKQVALRSDVMTVHHAAYYQTGAAVPADWDDPTPVPFLSAEGHFLIAISGPDGWRDVAFQILGLALAREGVGAKTSSGYGRLALAYAEAGVHPPDLVFPVLEEANRTPGAIGSVKAKAAAPGRMPEQPKAPAAPEKKAPPPLSPTEFLKDVRGLKPSDPKDRKKLQDFMRGGLEKFKRLDEAGQKEVAKALFQQIAGSGRQAEYANMPLFKEVDRIRKS